MAKFTATAKVGLPADRFKVAPWTTAAELEALARKALLEGVSRHIRISSEKTKWGVIYHASLDLFKGEEDDK